VIWRYVCPNCLRTFLSEEYTEEWFCWRCGQGLEVIPKNIEDEKEEKHENINGINKLK
jgi:rRNA maturation endonuclease Nob1